MAGRSATRFDTLDLLRGIAAASVFTLHFSTVFGAPELLPHAYLAVDLFFVLSGFVIAQAYEKRLMDGEPVGRFMIRRLIRLYPLYLVATVMGAVAIFSETLPGQLPARSFEQWLLSVCTALVFLPGTPYNAGGSSWFFAALFPAWSLFWELLANFAYGLVVRRLSTRMLALILVGGLVLVAATGVQYGTLDVGPRWGDAPGGAGRVIWGFFAGVALARLASRPSSASLGGPLALLLLAILAWPRGGWVYDFAIVALVFPLMVLLGARTARCSPLGSWLGFTSYGLYVIHVPLLKTVHAIASGTLPMPAMMALSLALVLAVADSLTRHVEVPVRAWLSGIALPRPSGAIPAEACAANGHAKPRQSRVSPQLLTTTSPPVT